MPFIIQPFFRKPFKLFAIDADTNQPVDPNVRKKTRVTYYELQNGSNGSKRLVAHKTASEVAKEAEANPAENTKPKPTEEPKKDEAPKTDDAVVAWTAEQDKTLKTMKEDGKTWVQIATETGKAKHECQARWKEIRPAEGEAQGKKDDGGKKESGGGGGNGGQQGQQNKGGDGQGQGKKGKKGKGGDNHQNNHQNQNNNQHDNHKKKEKKENKNHNNQQNNKPASVKPSKPASAPPAHPTANTNNEARFTMTDWLTLQEDDIFSFGELQCLSELIAKDMNQGWQRVAAKFYDLTGRRVHPDDVREKFESMAVVAEGKR
jgi:hypothetical protein